MMMTMKNKMKVKIMSKSNVKSLNALSVKLGKDSDAFNKVGALKNIYAALSGKESKGITVSDVIDEITTVAEKPTTQEVVWGKGTVSGEVTKASIPEGVTKIGQDAFYGYAKLKSITIPATVTSIGVNAFQGCLGLTSVTIPESVTEIEHDMFGNCFGLTEVILPASITAIGGNAFFRCTALASIYFKGTEEEWNAITKGNNWNSHMGEDVTGGTVITYNYTG